MTRSDSYFADTSRIADEILGYLADHPDAQDTIDGIAEWWLLEREIRHQTAVVKGAVEELVRKGLLMEHTGRDSRKRYAINQDRTANDR